MEGAGSIWNVGSWFWEEKNYNKWAHEVLPQKIKEITVDEVVITEVTKFKGEASINIRKGKTIYLFEFQIDCKWEAPGIDGTFKVIEFDQNDLDDIQVRATVTQTTQEADALRVKLQRQGPKAFKELFTTFLAEMKRLEASRLEDDSKRREEAKLTTSQAIEENGAEKQRIFEEVKAREAVVRVERVEEVKGSEWNTGSYFWEERTIPWANDKLNELLNALEFNLPGGSVRLKTVEAKGQSSYSVRKGKKILTFNYEIDIDWEAMLKDGEGNSLAQSEGQYKVIDFSPDDEYDVRLPNMSALHPHIKQYMNGQGKQRVVAALTEFVRLLRENNS